MNMDDVTFEDLLQFFPELELPVTLTEQSAEEFSRHNKAIPEVLIQKFLRQENEIWDELTEIVPCFKIPSTDSFHAIVFWKAKLQHYEYIMTTFDQSGEFIDGKVIAGTIFKGNMIIRTVATIDTDWIIQTVVGEENTTDSSLNKDSKAYTLELLGTGEIIFGLNEKNL